MRAAISGQSTHLNSLATQQCGAMLPELIMTSFSFNKPAGACPKCTGLGMEDRMMKRILNLNDFSLPALRVIFITGFGLPAVFFLSSRLLDQTGLHLPALEQFAWVLLRVGGCFLLLFFVLVALEQIQDYVLYRIYLRERGQQVQEECPFCGNRQVHPFEYFCTVCGEKIRRNA